MKKIVIILALLIATQVMVFANGKKKGDDIRKLKTELNLTDDQVKKIDVIYAKFEQKTKLNAPAANQKEQIKSNLKMRKERRSEVAKILTPDQRKAYIQIRQKQQAAPVKK
jgi:hypothetical protein